VGILPYGGRKAFRLVSAELLGGAKTTHMENRRLAAILIADIAGYTRLVEEDTDATVTAWKAARGDVIEPVIAQYSGRIVKLTGDGFLAEFPAVQDAVQCALDMQSGLATSSLDFRMGVNLGDIVDDGQDIHGEGVNIAARIEALADEGGICISGDVYSQVRNRIEAAFTDMGEHQVKHVSHPVRVYTVNSGITQVVKTEQTAKSTPVQPAEKASIAILPFDNISTDPEQEYFCDGMVEDIITEISKFRWLSVIARNSTFTYKGKSVDIKTVGQELGARYVVEGSVRKSGNRIRITAQLIDSTDGSHVWAEKYDRELADIFDLQDEITQTLVGVIEPELAAAEQTRARKKPTESLDAWGFVQKASWVRSKFTAASYDEADILLDQALSLDPEFAYAQAFRSYIAYASVIMGYADDAAKSIDQGEKWARKAIALDNREAFAYLALGANQTIMGKYEAALTNFEYAISLNPNFAQAHMLRAVSILMSGNGNVDEIILGAQTGIKLSPKDQVLWAALNGIGCAHLLKGDLETAAQYYQLACQTAVTNYYPFFYLAGTLKLMGQDKEAQSAMASAFKMNPTLTAAKLEQQLGKPMTSRLDPTGMHKALRDLGLPDG
jgi:adenylate cyclase